MSKCWMCEKELNVGQVLVYEAMEKEYTLLEERLKEAEEVIEFYGTHRPYQFPEGWYEIHISDGVSGHDKFGTKAQDYLEKYKNE